VRPLASLLLVLAACTVGPGGSFPDTGAASTVAMTTTATTADTDDETGTSEDPSASTSGASDDDATSEAPSDTSSAVSEDDTSAASDPSDPTGAEESSTDATDTASGTPLDPDLDIPNGGEQCDYPGDLQQCAGVATVCRFATAEYGLCESCDACGNLFDPCVEGTDCDILFSCYAGSCTNFCTLGLSECGPVEDCLDIGHPTRGVCDPFA
jgi:hypothetical protein